MKTDLEAIVSKVKNEVSHKFESNDPNLEKVII